MSQIFVPGRSVDVRPTWAPRYSRAFLRSADCCEALVAALCSTAGTTVRLTDRRFVSVTPTLADEVQEHLFSFLSSFICASPTLAEALCGRQLQDLFARLVMGNQLNADRPDERLRSMLLSLLCTLMQYSTKTSALTDLLVRLHSKGSDCARRDDILQLLSRSMAAIGPCSYLHFKQVLYPRPPRYLNVCNPLRPRSQTSSTRTCFSPSYQPRRRQRSA